jgi:hypothetical protein
MRRSRRGLTSVFKHWCRRNLSLVAAGETDHYAAARNPDIAAFRLSSWRSLTKNESCTAALCQRVAIADALSEAHAIRTADAQALDRRVTF